MDVAFTIMMVCVMTFIFEAGLALWDNRFVPPVIHGPFTCVQMLVEGKYKTEEEYLEARCSREKQGFLAKVILFSGGGKPVMVKSCLGKSLGWSEPDPERWTVWYECRRRIEEGQECYCITDIEGSGWESWEERRADFSGI